MSLCSMSWVGITSGTWFSFFCPRKRSSQLILTFSFNVSAFEHHVISLFILGKLYIRCPIFFSVTERGKSIWRALWKPISLDPFRWKAFVRRIFCVLRFAFLRFWFLLSPILFRFLSLFTAFVFFEWIFSNQHRAQSSFSERNSFPFNVSNDCTFNFTPLQSHCFSLNSV